MRHLTLTVALMAGFSTAGIAQQTPEAQQSSAEHRWNAVIDNDTLSSIIKDSHVSIIGKAPAASDVASEKTESLPQITKDSPNSQHVTVRIGFCGDSAFPTWCPKEIRIHQGDDVQLTLINDFYGWQSPNGGLRGESASFVLTAAEPIEACTQQPVPAGQRENCRKFPQFGVSQFLQYGTTNVHFVASEAGKFKYYDGFHRSGFGVLVVEP